MNESLKIDRSVDQLGLPPMELAESSTNGRTSNSVYNCLYSTLQKVFLLLLLLTFSAGTYILLLKLIENTDTSRNTDVIVVTETKGTANFTLHREDMDIFFQIYNTTNSSSKRLKRSTFNFKRDFINQFNEHDAETVKEIILKHRNLCRNPQQHSVCNKLITKLKTIVENNGTLAKFQEKFFVDANDSVDKFDETVMLLSSGVKKREAHPLIKLKGIVRSASDPFNNHPTNLLPHNHLTGQHPLTDNCLLAKLLRQNYPQAQGVYESPLPDSEHLDHHHRTAPDLRFLQPPMLSSFVQSREGSHGHRRLPIVHPQDLEIFMNFLTTPKPEDEEGQVKSNSTTRNVQCSFGTRSCGNGMECIEEKLWCDGQADCPDSSDEISCSCKSRVDSSRLCDGYFDCPLGEDEMGCFGCSEDTFSCEDLGTNSQSTCFSKEQRCNNIVECANHKDEIDCNMLAPSLLEKPMFSISSTEGFLHRNFKGDWYAVCQNPYMWAHDACRRETGLIIRPPLIQIIPIDPMLKISYLNTAPGGVIQQTDTCFNNSAIYVTCPDFLCGTRVASTSQLLKENAEMSLFGRNKRFLFPKHSFNPYQLMNYGNRMKRDTSAVDDIESTALPDWKRKNLLEDNTQNVAESRVVGGKPSQPAAWPWMVAMYRDGMFHCGGVVLTQDWIISAAHCVHKFWDHYYEIQVGMLRRFSFSPQEQIHKVTHIIVNQHYKQADMKNDLSLLKVEPGIQFSRWVRPICLPSVNTAGSDWLWGPAPGTICTAVGWGATAEHGPDPDHMREVEVPIWEKCKHREDVAGKEICAGFMSGGKDACQGDSGGPLLCKNPMNEQQWYLSGIVSHGDGCGRQHEPGVYTRVSLFVKWIKFHTTTPSLPLVQPIQECPGFKCKFGILKCLPNSRKCDRIVDCLNAEDEMNCTYNNTIEQQEKSSEIRGTETKDSITNESMKASVMKPEENPSTTNKWQATDSTVNPSATHSLSLIDSTENPASSQRRHINDSENLLATHKEFSVESTENPSTTHKSPLVRSEENESTTHRELPFDSTDNPSTTSSWHINKSKDNLSTSHNREFLKEAAADLIPFFNASTLEMSISKSTEEESSSDESVTGDPIIDKGTEIDRGDLPSIAVSFNQNELESRAILKKIDDKNEVKSLPMVENVTVVSNQDLDNSLTPNTDDQISESTDHSEKVIIKLLPNVQSNETNENLLDKKNDHVSTIATETELVPTTESLVNNLAEAESKSNLINKLEQLVASDLQPANRKKHQTPQEFECRRIPQLISFNQRCDHKADCEDGTDELECNCLDYLSSYDDNLICDGIFDCAGGEDESDCYGCPEQHFLCKRSEVCLPQKYVCDGKAQCPSGEDEFNCFALTNGREIFYDVDEKPKINLEGFLTERNNDNWQVMCENDLSAEQQEQSAVHICHYLGFSTANKYMVKYVNIREKDIIGPNTLDKRKRRNTGISLPLQFAYRDVREDNKTSKQILIDNPQVLKEECVPNVTKTCKSLYVSCDRSLYTDFVFSEQLRSVESTQNNYPQMWPWIAKIFMEGDYKCTGILVELSWVLISDSCLWDASSTYHFITVVVGSQRTINSVTGYYEKVHKVDAKKYLYRSRVVLLHLEKPAEYSNLVKPMILSSSYFHPDNNTFCVAVGQDNSNSTVSIFLEETNKNCNPSNRCFMRRDHQKLCQSGEKSHHHWAGLISCHNNQGWFPTASFVDSTGECGLGQTINATDIENLRYDIKHYSAQINNSETNNLEDSCEGLRCGRGVCLPLKNVCDGVKQCEDGKDEDKKSCEIKHAVCKENPYYRGCDCASGQMKCKNGNCIPKEFFGNGHDDCGDGSDEPRRSSLCSDYLARVMPSKLCDGVLHCEDRSDEDPLYCKCFAKRAVPCNSNKANDMVHCVARDMVCDGVPDCPHGDDEHTCMGLSAPVGTKYGTGQVIIQSHGVWHSKCYSSLNHTKFELEKICRELGFISGHAKEIKNIEQSVLHNSIILDSFIEVPLNDQTSIKLRNTEQPLAIAVVDQEKEHCHPVFIECL